MLCIALLGFAALCVALLGFALICFFPPTDERYKALYASAVTGLYAGYAQAMQHCTRMKRINKMEPSSHMQVSAAPQP